MRDLSKQIRGALPFIFVFLLFPFVYSLEECTNRMSSEDVPCLVLLPNLQNNCGTINIQFYKENQSVYNSTMQQYSPSKCSAVFNQSTPATYNFYYSSGDTGSIIVNGGKMIQLLILTGLLGAFILLFFGFYTKDVAFLNFGSIFLFMIGLYVSVYSFGNLNNVYTQGVGVTLIATGAYIFIRANIDAIQ